MGSTSFARTAEQSSSKGNSRPWRTAVVVVVVAVLWQWIVSQRQPKVSFGGTPYPAAPQPSFLTPQQVADFERDGFLLLRNAVEGDQLAELVQNAVALYQETTLMDLIFRRAFAKLSMQIWRSQSAFARFSFMSVFPSVAAELLHETSSIRILKDALFGYKKGGEGCGFHVDDEGFWPARNDTTGINVWLALSPMRVAEGGGIRVVNQTLLEKKTAAECTAVIRQGFNTTCRMELLSKPCHDAMLAASVIYDMEPGDVLLWDPWTFHRSEPFVADSTVEETKLRYTVRYMPSQARGAGPLLHKSVSAGSLFDSPYYPQVWPTARKEEIDVIRQGMEGDFALGSVLKRWLYRKMGWLKAS